MKTDGDDGEATPRGFLASASVPLEGGDVLQSRVRAPVNPEGSLGGEEESSARNAGTLAIVPRRKGDGGDGGGAAVAVGGGGDYAGDDGGDDVADVLQDAPEGLEENDVGARPA